jgi:mannose-1-phosphate guanylyltransferase
MRPRAVALILAGGAGTRFWPASRARRPKQLLSLTGDEPLLRQTAKRVLGIVGGWDRVFVASGAHLEGPTLEILPELPRGNLLLEPEPRNTAPCIGWAAARIARAEPDTVVMALPSDHHIGEPERYARAVEAAVRSAASGTITTIGIRPTHPETGFGYVALAGEISNDSAVMAKGFVEKPDRARAEAFVRGGVHLWNAGMFFFRARDMVEAIRAHLPALSRGLDELDRAHAAGAEAAELPRVFAAMPSISIDHGVMEHLPSLAVVAGDFGWSDVGSWQAAWELASKDGAENAAPEHAALVDARGNLVLDLRSGAPAERTVALLGVEGLVVVETDDALLVVPRDRAQDVRVVVELLKRRGRSALT